MELSKFTTREAIETMLRLRGKLSVSVLVPLMHANPGHHEDWEKIDRLMNDALSELDKTDSMFKGKIRDAVNSIMPFISFNRNNKGLGIYAAADFLYIAYFPFSVLENVAVAPVFQLKELFRLSQFSADTMLLAISSKKARLFRALDPGMREEVDGNFPLVFEDDYEYESPSRGTSYAGSAHVKSFEKDKSIVRKRRFRDFLRKLDGILGNYVTRGCEFIVSGTSEHVAELRSLTRHGKYLSSEVIGGYDWYDASEYNTLLWPVLQKRIGEKVIDMLEYYSRRAGEGFSEHGMTQVWNAVKEGRVDTLLVENGYETTGHVLGDQQLLFEGSGTLDKEGHFYSTAVNELVQLAALQQAGIFFLDKDLMPADSHVAAICRY